MESITIKFTISIEFQDIGTSGPVFGYTLGLRLENHTAVRELAMETGFDIVCHNAYPGREYVGIEVFEPPDSPRLIRLFKILEERYGFKPWPYAVFDIRQRDKYFGVKRMRTFTKKEIDTSEYMSFGCSTSLGHPTYRTEEQFKSDQYVVDKVAPLKRDPALGCLSPFHAHAVMPLMRKALLDQNLIGLDADSEVVGSKGNLYKLGSHIILPRTLTRLVNGQGEDVDPDVWKVTTIHGGTEDHLYDDGHRPCIIRYRREDFEKVAPFDVAMTYEFIGNHKQGAYRGLVVSQRFRQVLKELKVRGVHYFPIQLE